MDEQVEQEDTFEVWLRSQSPDLVLHVAPSYSAPRAVNVVTARELVALIDAGEGVSPGPVDQEADPLAHVETMGDWWAHLDAAGEGAAAPTAEPGTSRWTKQVGAQALATALRAADVRSFVSASDNGLLVRVAHDQAELLIARLAGDSTPGDDAPPEYLELIRRLRQAAVDEVPASEQSSVVRWADAVLRNPSAVDALAELRGEPVAWQLGLADGVIGQEQLITELGSRIGVLDHETATHAVARWALDRLTPDTRRRIGLAAAGIQLPEQVGDSAAGPGTTMKCSRCDDTIQLIRNLGWASTSTGGLVCGSVATSGVAGGTRTTVGHDPVADGPQPLIPQPPTPVYDDAPQTMTGDPEPFVDTPARALGRLLFDERELNLTRDHAQAAAESMIARMERLGRWSLVAEPDEFADRILQVRPVIAHLNRTGVIRQMDDHQVQAALGDVLSVLEGEDIAKELLDPRTFPPADPALAGNPLTIRNKGIGAVHQRLGKLDSMSDAELLEALVGYMEDLTRTKVSSDALGELRTRFIGRELGTQNIMAVGEAPEGSLTRWLAELKDGNGMLAAPNSGVYVEVSVEGDTRGADTWTGSIAKALSGVDLTSVDNADNTTTTDKSDLRITPIGQDELLGTLKMVREALCVAEHFTPVRPDQPGNVPSALRHLDGSAMKLFPTLWQSADGTDRHAEPTVPGPFESWLTERGSPPLAHQLTVVRALDHTLARFPQGKGAGRTWMYASIVMWIGSVDPNVVHDARTVDGLLPGVRQLISKWRHGAGQLEFVSDPDNEVNEAIVTQLRECAMDLWAALDYPEGLTATEAKAVADGMIEAAGLPDGATPLEVLAALSRSEAGDPAPPSEQAVRERAAAERQPVEDSKGKVGFAYDTDPADDPGTDDDEVSIMGAVHHLRGWASEHVDAADYGTVVGALPGVLCELVREGWRPEDHEVPMPGDIVTTIGGPTGISSQMVPHNVHGDPGVPDHNPIVWNRPDIGDGFEGYAPRTWEQIEADLERAKGRIRYAAFWPGVSNAHRDDLRTVIRHFRELPQQDQPDPTGARKASIELVAELLGDEYGVHHDDDVRQHRRVASRLFDIVNAADPRSPDTEKVALRHFASKLLGRELRRNPSADRDSALVQLNLLLDEPYTIEAPLDGADEAGESTTSMAELIVALTRRDEDEVLTITSSKLPAMDPMLVGAADLAAWLRGDPEKVIRLRIPNDAVHYPGATPAEQRVWHAADEYGVAGVLSVLSRHPDVGASANGVIELAKLGWRLGAKRLAELLAPNDEDPTSELVESMTDPNAHRVMFVAVDPAREGEPVVWVRGDAPLGDRDVIVLGYSIEVAHYRRALTHLLGVLIEREARMFHRGKPRRASDHRLIAGAVQGILEGPES